MVCSLLRAAACLTAFFALLGPAAAQSGTPPGTQPGQMPGATAPAHPPSMRHRGEMKMNKQRMPGQMRHGGMADSPADHSAAMPRDERLSDPSRDCAPTAAGAGAMPLTQKPTFRSDMSQCTRLADRDERAACVRELWESSGGTAACL